MAKTGKTMNYLRVDGVDYIIGQRWFATNTLQNVIIAAFNDASFQKEIAFAETTDFGVVAILCNDLIYEESVLTGAKYTVINNGHVYLATYSTTGNAYSLSSVIESREIVFDDSVFGKYYLTSGGDVKMYHDNNATKFAGYTAFINTLGKTFYCQFTDLQVGYVYNGGYYANQNGTLVITGGGQLTLYADFEAKTVQTALDKLASEGAKIIGYDNIKSGLYADNVQDAIDETAIYNYEEKALTLFANQFLNLANVEVGSEILDDRPSEYEGTYCIKLSVEEGQKYKIIGKGNEYAFKTYAITDENYIITRLTTSSSTNTIIKIQPSEKYLFVNLFDYDDSTDGVWKIIQTTTKTQIIKNSENIENMNVKSFNKIIDLSDKLLLNKGFNLTNVSVGTRFTAPANDYAGTACAQITVYDKCKYEIKGLGSLYAFKLYAFLDINLKVLEIVDTIDNSKQEPILLTPPAGARKLIINLNEYNPDNDYIKVLQSYSIEDNYLNNFSLNGETVAFFGDSITEFKGYDNATYPDWVKTLFGCNIYNFGIGGTRISQRGEPTSTPSTEDEAYAGLDMATLFSSIESEDFTIPESCAAFLNKNEIQEKISILKTLNWEEITSIVVMGGTNDWNGRSPLGTQDEINKLSTIGAMNYIIQSFSAKYPNIKIFWLTPTVRWIYPFNADNWGGNYVVNDKTLLQFVDAIKSNAENNLIPVKDMYRTLGWNKSNFWNFFVLEEEDGTHPSKGYKWLAEKVGKFLKSN